MTSVRSCARTFIVLIAIAAGLHSEIVRADITGLGSDGWQTWRVEAVENAPEMCCFSWSSGAASRRQCDLDRRHGGFGSSEENPAANSTVQIYVLMKGGDIAKIRALSASCPVVAGSRINDLGPINADDSADWLRQFVGSEEFGSQAIAAIAVHEGSMARSMLVDAAKPGNNLELREDAIFWMAQARLEETADDMKHYVFADESAAIRKHAAFSYSQSKAADVADTLIRQGRDDRMPDVRSQAWFWLAQTESVEAEAAIRHALLNDADEGVRDEAVFALSQLPERRAVNALAAILEDRSLEMEIREQALFWLAQTESDEAFEYIDRLLSDN